MHAINSLSFPMLLGISMTAGPCQTDPRPASSQLMMGIKRHVQYSGYWNKVLVLVLET